MNTKRPYTHILKNLFHEQAAEIIPLLLPGYQVEQVLDIDMPELRTIETEDADPPSEFEQGLVKLAMPDATLINTIHTEWIEHSGNFERAYRIQTAKTEKPVYMVFEFQLEREDKKDIALRLLSHLATVNVRVAEEIEPGHKKTTKKKTKEKEYYVDAAILCPFPQDVPAPIRETMLTFNFKAISLWEKDARELLNTHVSAIYFLLPTMKNADAALLGLAIEELAQRFQGDDIELGRHLTGLSLLLQQSETMSEAEKLATQAHLKRFAHLIKDDPDDE